MRNVPGRKTDVKDAGWIAELVRHGLVRASFVPPPEVRGLRDLVRHRKALAGTLAAERNRTLKLLESAGIKLAGVMSDVFGISGMLMLEALADGTATPAAMAGLQAAVAVQARPAHPRARGRLAEHQPLLLRTSAAWRRSGATSPSPRPRSGLPCCTDRFGWCRGAGSREERPCHDPRTPAVPLKANAARRHRIPRQSGTGSLTGPRTRPACGSAAA